MNKAVIIGIEGETGLWLADLEKGTVTPVTVPLTGNLAPAAALREKGVTVVKGVNFAVAFESAAVVADSNADV